jgi:flagellar biosynthetic protein FliP
MSARRRGQRWLFAGLGLAVLWLLSAHPASAADLASALPSAPTPPTPPTPPSAPVSPADISINVGGDKPSNAVTLIIAMTLLSVAPAILLLTTSYTKIVVVLSLTRNALGLQQSPPNQVLAGLALFMTMFIMGPTLSAVNEDAVQPYLKGSMTASQAYESGVKPLRAFMEHNTRKDELALFTKVAGNDKPKSAADVPLSTLVPAFILSELKSAFIIGMIIFIPFLVIDLLVSAALMAMGMMMVPPVMVSLPFKLLLFVMVDGWALIVTALVRSYQ